MGDSVILFETDKIAFTDEAKADIDLKIQFYHKLKFILLDVEYFQPPLMEMGIPKYLWMVPLSNKSYIESGNLVYYIKLIYELEYHFNPRNFHSRFARFIEILVNSIGNRERIYEISKD